MTESRSEAPRRKKTFTVEIAAWAAILLVASVLRVVGLDAAPLSIPEAREAISAWRSVAEGPVEGTRAAGGLSPFLLAATALSFTLFGASDGAARLWPALLGSGLVITPWLIRHRIGRIGSLAAGLLLAISPTLLVASRQVDGTVLAAAGCMIAVGGLTQAADGGRARWLPISACGLAVCLASSPIAYSLVAPLSVAAAATAWAMPTTTIQSLWITASARSTTTILLFATTLIVVAAGVAWNLPGLAQAAGLAGEWVSGFGSGGIGASRPFAVAMVYEILPIGLAIGGLVWAIRQRDRFAVLLGVWSGLALALLWVRRDAPPLEATAAVLPLSLLAGFAFECLVTRLRQPAARTALVILAPTSLVIWGYCALVVAHYAKRGTPADLVLVLLAMGLQIVMAAAVAYVVQAPAALSAVAAGWSIAFLLATVAAGWGATQVRPADPREIILDRPTDPGVHDLLQTLEAMSWRRTGTPRQLTFTYEASADSVLAWYLRDFLDARRLEPGAASAVELSETVHVASHDASSPWLAGEAVGQDFAVHRQWDFTDLGCTWQDRLDCTSAARWLLYRSAPLTHTEDDRAVLWLRDETTP